MEAKLGVFNNTNAFLVTMGVSGNDLRKAQMHDSNPLSLKDKEGNITFQLMSSPKVSATTNVVTLPIQATDEKAKVLFNLEGDPDQVKYLAAMIKKNLDAVEKQVTKVNTEIDKAIETVTELA